MFSENMFGHGQLQGVLRKTYTGSDFKSPESSLDLLTKPGRFLMEYKFIMEGFFSIQHRRIFYIC